LATRALKQLSNRVLAFIPFLTKIRPVVSSDGVTQARPAPRTSSVPILIVEDDFAIRRTLANLLAEEGYEVTCAADGREAFSLLVDRGFRPRLIILDLWMPTMNGFQFRALQQDYARWAEIPVLVITASRFNSDDLSGLGLTHILRKPLQLDDLLAKTEELTSDAAAPS
jgi:CheY-like chemotaxis protein